MIGRCGSVRPASLIDWREDRYLESATVERFGHGTAAAPFDITIYGNNQNTQSYPEVILRALVGGTLNYTLETWSRQYWNYGVLNWLLENETLWSAFASMSGTDSQSGSAGTFNAGELIQFRFSRAGGDTSTLDKVRATFWMT
jgi:hypothetical protein